MSASVTWESVLAAPTPRQHIAQLYTEPGFLARAVGRFVGEGLPATIRLEELWAELMTTHSFSLLCGYSLDNFDSQIHRGLLQRVSTAHSDVIPVDDYARLDRAVERAYADIFGPSGEPASLRSTFLAHYARPAAMPDAEAAILAVRQFVPVMADELLDRVRHHYRTDHDAPAAN